MLKRAQVGNFLIKQIKNGKLKLQNTVVTKSNNTKIPLSEKIFQKPLDKRMKMSYNRGKQDKRDALGAKKDFEKRKKKR